jgi:hypothetical protein
MRAVIFSIVAGLGVANAQPSNPAPTEPDASTPADPVAAPAAPSADAPATEAPAQTLAPDPEVTAIAEPPASPAPSITPSNTKDIAWLFVGGALTFVTAGAVLAYSVDSSEQDLRDLYVVNNNNDPATFDEKTRERYDELVAEGKRYERLAWTSFGLAAGCAIGATIFFVRASRERDESLTSRAGRITPIISARGAGVRVQF